jgi:hypothetical protein
VNQSSLLSLRSFAQCVTPITSLTLSVLVCTATYVVCGTSTENWVLMDYTVNVTYLIN